MRASRISLSALSFLLHGSSCLPDVDFAACAWYLVNYAILLVWVCGIFWSDQPGS